MVSHLLKAGWPHNYEVEILSGLPPIGPEPVQLRATSQGIGREGLVVRVTVAAVSWVGNFQRGDGKLTGIYSTPSIDHVCVVASGRGYWVQAQDPADCHIVEAYPIQDAKPIAEIGLLIFADYTDLVAYGAQGRRWVSQRVSWDGITILHADEHGVVGRAYDATKEQEVGFFVDTESGRLEGGAAPPALD